MKGLKPIHSQYMPSYPLGSTRALSFPPSNTLTNIFSYLGEKRSNQQRHLTVEGETAAGAASALAAEGAERRLGASCYEVKGLSNIKDKAGGESPHPPCPEVLALTSGQQ